jgi:quinol monooxygenase YgiN
VAELFIFARFHAIEGKEGAVEAAIREVIPQTRAEPGCVAVAGRRSTRDPQLSLIHSCWADEAAFERHAGLSHTMRFVEPVSALIDYPFEAACTTAIV